MGFGMISRLVQKVVQSISNATDQSEAVRVPDGLEMTSSLPVLITGLFMFFFTCLVLSPAVGAGKPDHLVIAFFSSLEADSDLPAEWEPFLFKNIPSHTNYALVTQDGNTVVRAISEASASGLVRKIEVDPKAYPILEWRWKVNNILTTGDVSQKSGDDYAARIYVTFAYDPSQLSFGNRIKYKAAKMLYGEYPPTGALNYIWGSKAPKNQFVPNPYTDRAMMVVVETGSEKIGQWVTHSRNLLDDYRRAFQSDPPKISGIVIMTDTDNTGESATAYYGDIVLRAVPQ